MDLSLLNDEQKEAILYNNGPLLIIAGAGSGKTRCITYKIAYLIEQGIDEKNILAITFTNKAADEMKERVRLLLNNERNNVFISTFHKFCGRILKGYIETIGYDKNFSIYDKLDQLKLMTRILKDLQIDEKNIKPKAVVSIISYCKSHNISKEDYEKSAQSIFEKNISKCFFEYEERMFKSNAIDFDDMLILAVKVLKNNQNIRDILNERFKYILVDEYQDTNSIQLELIHLLCEKYKYLTVVGDDDQSIYSFRGADIKNILTFENVFTGAKVVKLTQNYRSTNNILNCANSIIKNNVARKGKKLWSDMGDGVKPEFYEFQDANSEARFVIQSIKKDKNYKNTAILYRTNAQSRSFEDCLRQENIPYVVIGDVSFYARREVKDVIAYLRLAVNNGDNESLFRVINIPKRGIGDLSLNKIIDYANDNEISIYDALCCAKSINLRPKIVDEINKFINIIDLIRSKNEIADMINVIKNDAGYINFLMEEYDKLEIDDRIANVNELINKSKSNFENDVEDDTLQNTFNNLSGVDLLAEFLRNMSLVESTDSISNENDVVTLMSFHASKGLEFDNVYMVGMNEGLFPSSKALSSIEDSDIEEERRLCYVGITRCKRKLILSSCDCRFINGTQTYSKVSRFIDEIYDKYINKNMLNNNFDLFSNDHYDKSYINKYRNYKAKNYLDNNDYKDNNYTKQFDKVSKAFDVNDYKIKKNKPKIDFVVGDRVSHIKFGDGLVKDIKETDKDYEVTVLFDDGNEKILYQAFAKLTKI